MTDLAPLSPENTFQIDFNFQQVPSALALDIPPEAAAAMLHITPSQFTTYTELAFAECTRTAQTLLDEAGTREAIYKLKTPRAEIPNTIMAIGDSITTYRYGYAEILRALLQLGEPETPVQFHNHGRSGYTSTHGLEHTFAQYLAQRPDWVFIKYGVNDTKRFGGRRGKLLVSLEEYIANMTQIIDAFLGIDAYVVLLTPTPVIASLVNEAADFQAMDMTWDNDDVRACGEALKAIAVTRNVSVIDLFSMFTPDPSLYVADGLHPGPAGHRLIIEQVLSSINNALR